MQNEKSKLSAKLTTADRVRFSIAFFICSLFWMSALGIVGSVLFPQHLKDIVGGTHATTIFGIINSVNAVVSLVANLVFGNLSDRTRSRYGRRTPWIIGGGIFGGITLFFTGISNNIWLMSLMYALCMIGVNAIVAPIMATFSDRIPSNARATMSAFSSAGVTVGNALGTLIGAHFIAIQIPGFIASGVLMGIAGIAAVIIWPSEKSSKDLPPVKGGLKEFLLSFRPPLKGARDFWLAFAGRTLLIFSYYMILNYQLYILEIYIGEGKEAAAATISTMSVITMIVGLVGSLISGTISDKVGRRKVPVIIASFLLALGYFLPWMLHSPLSMLLFAGFAGLGYAVYGAVDQALNVDVLPNKQAAGKDLGIINMATTLGQTTGPLITSALVALSGYKLVFPVAIVFAIVACIFIQLIRCTK